MDCFPYKIQIHCFLVLNKSRQTSQTCRFQDNLLLVDSDGRSLLPCKAAIFLPAVEHDMYGCEFNVGQDPGIRDIKGITN